MLRGASDGRPRRFEGTIKPKTPALLGFGSATPRATVSHVSSDWESFRIRADRNNPISEQNILTEDPAPSSPSLHPLADRTWGLYPGEEQGMQVGTRITTAPAASRLSTAATARLSTGDSLREVTMRDGEIFEENDVHSLDVVAEDTARSQGSLFQFTQRCRTTWQQRLANRVGEPTSSKPTAPFELLGKNSMLSPRNREAIPQQGKPFEVFWSANKQKMMDARGTRDVATSMTPQRALSYEAHEEPAKVQMHFVDKIAGVHKANAQYITKTSVSVSRPMRPSDQKDTPRQMPEIVAYKRSDRPQSGGQNTTFGRGTILQQTSQVGSSSPRFPARRTSTKDKVQTEGNSSSGPASPRSLTDSFIHGDFVALYDAIPGSVSRASHHTDTSDWKIPIQLIDSPSPEVTQHVNIASLSEARAKTAHTSKKLFVLDRLPTAMKEKLERDDGVTPLFAHMPSRKKLIAEKSESNPGSLTKAEREAFWLSSGSGNGKLYPDASNNLGKLPRTSTFARTPRFDYQRPSTTQKLLENGSSLSDEPAEDNQIDFALRVLTVDVDGAVKFHLANSKRLMATSYDVQIRCDQKATAQYTMRANVRGGFQLTVSGLEPGSHVFDVRVRPSVDADWTDWTGTISCDVPLPAESSSKQISRVSSEISHIAEGNEKEQTLDSIENLAPEDAGTLEPAQPLAPLGPAWISVRSIQDPNGGDGLYLNEQKVSCIMKHPVREEVLHARHLGETMKYRRQLDRNGIASKIMEAEKRASSLLTETEVSKRSLQEAVPEIMAYDGARIKPAKAKTGNRQSIEDGQDIIDLVLGGSVEFRNKDNLYSD